MRNFYGTISTILIIFSILIYGSGNPRINKNSGNKLRSGDEDFHRFRKRQYKRVKAGSSYTTVPLLEVEDAAFWRNEGQNRLLQQLKVKPVMKRAKNVIFFLGDGMSISTVTATRILKGQKTGKWERETLTFEDFPYSALIKSYTTDSQVSDSAASATAYLCGVKGNLATIGVDVNVHKENCSAQQIKDYHTPSLIDWFQNDGRSSGIVTTMRVTHATPAGGYAHTADREWEDDHEVRGDGLNPNECDDIAEQLIEKSPGNKLKVILGGGRRNLTPNTVSDEEEPLNGYRTDGKNLIRTWQQQKKNEGARAKYVWSRDQLLKTNLNATDYLLGLFSWSHMDYILDRDVKMDPSLPEMTRAALQILKKDQKGYFLLVEGGLIDHGHHGNKGQKALTETLEFDEAVQAALDMTNTEDTLIVVTSDHSHSLSINGYPSRHTDILGVADFSDIDFMPYTTLLYGNGPGFTGVSRDGFRSDPTVSDLHESNYRQASAVPESSSAHSGDDIGLWAKGPHSHLFTGCYDQTYIPYAIAYAACVGKGHTFCSRRNGAAHNRGFRG